MNFKFCVDISQCIYVTVLKTRIYVFCRANIIALMRMLIVKESHIDMFGLKYLNYPTVMT